MGKPSKHKRKGPKSTRAGCLMCKPHKDQSANGSPKSLTYQEKKAPPFNSWEYRGFLVG